MWLVRIRRGVPLIVLAAVSVISPVAAQPIAPPPPAASLLPDGDREWVVTFQPAPMHVAPSVEGDLLGQLRPYTYLEVLGYEDTWARVYNPRTRLEAYVPSDVLGPIEALPPYLGVDPPPAVDTVNLSGRVIRTAPLSFYPTAEADARVGTLSHNTPVDIVDSVQGDDGGMWYRTLEGDYLQAGAVRLPRPPSRTFEGLWIDADLSEPVLVTAYDGDQVIASAMAIKGSGAHPTPTGLFRIGRRVANEIMNSETIGIPRFSAGGYYLTNVLYTQYFTGDGASIHYNYWSSNFGYAGSHGCLGMTLADSRFFWDWATVGTPINIHY